MLAAACAVALLSGAVPTRFTAPLAADGLVDIEAAVNARLAAGVTPATNANVALWQILGPTPAGEKSPPAEYFRLLGAPKPPAAGDYFRPLKAYLETLPELTPERRAEVTSGVRDWGKRPWQTADAPGVAAWLAANAGPLDRVAAAVRRPHYYNPLVAPRGDKPGLMLETLLPSVQAARELATALTVRAMLRLGGGEGEAAWADILTAFRLARHVGSGGAGVEYLTGIAIDRDTVRAAAAFAEHARLTPDRLAGCRRDVAARPARPTVARCLDVVDRGMFFDHLNAVRRRGLGALDDAIGAAGPPPKDAPQVFAGVDFSAVEAKANRLYDSAAAAVRRPDWAGREKAVFDYLLRVGKIKAEAGVRAGPRLQAARAGRPADRRAAQAVGDVMIVLHSPSLAKLQKAADSTAQFDRNLTTAFALAAYKLDRGRYPATLAGLVPAYLPAVPVDVFSGKPVVYKLTAAGYELYSVGPNGADDGGPDRADRVGDDIGVRVPP